jgi:hypothetical protein
LKKDGEESPSQKVGRLAAVVTASASSEAPLESEVTVPDDASKVRDHARAPPVAIATKAAARRIASFFYLQPSLRQQPPPAQKRGNEKN